MDDGTLVLPNGYLVGRNIRSVLEAVRSMKRIRVIVVQLKIRCVAFRGFVTHRCVTGIGARWGNKA